MRASNDFLIVGMTGLGTALFLMQLLTVGRQIAVANDHIRTQLAIEASLPVDWMNGPTRWHPPFPAFDVERLSPNNDAIPFIAIQPAYPQRALDEGVEGFADITFTLSANGSPSNPTITNEYPKGYGFGAALLRVFPRWRFRTIWMNTGATSEIAVTRLDFRLLKTLRPEISWPKVP